MLEGFNKILSVFAEFITAVFSLPFYDSITVGWLLLGIEILGVIATFLFSRLQ